MLLVLFLLFLLVVLVFLRGAIQCANPYRLIFVFGKKGSGKSCYMVNQMLRYSRRGWWVYTDMEGVRIPGVRQIHVNDLVTLRPLPHSLVCLDEVGISMDNRNYKSFPPGLRDFFKYARKMKCRVIINSQSYDVDKKVRDTVDSMLLTVALGPLSIVRPIKRSITLVEPSAESEGRISDRLSFSSIFSWRFYWLPFYFPYFDTLAMPQRKLIRVDPSPGVPDCIRSPWSLALRRAWSSFCSLCSRVVPVRFR